ncbi:hypothetical protein MRBLMI12_000448 [Microbacterium sp. LMI12-1-1.1]|uniref:hypothetical protein n=1 Tax=Microbacterium sp. LMI12-1-1.1 TaxID=3135225 RepID=UPI00343EBF02
MTSAAAQAYANATIAADGFWSGFSPANLSSIRRALAAAYDAGATSDLEIKGRQLFAALAHIFLDSEIGDRAREVTKDFPSPEEFRTPTAEQLAEALCHAMPHPGGGSQLVYEDALEAAEAAIKAARA